MRVDYCMDSEISIIDLFCGAGGFSYGFEMEDDRYTVRAGVDMEEHAVETFEENHTDAIGIVDDMSEIQPSDVEDHLTTDINVVIGGPPCKGFSLIRPDKDTIDYRNYLYKDYLEFVDYFEPEVFVMENVPAITSHSINGTKILDELTAEIEDIGYTYDWKILNSAYYGVPQARSRFILIGTKTDAHPIQFPEPTHTFEDNTVEEKRITHPNDTLQPNTDDLQSAVTVMDAISDLPHVSAGEQKTDYVSQAENRFQEIMRQNTSEPPYHKSTNHSDRIVETLDHAGYSRSEIPEEYRPPTGYESTYSRLYPNQPATTVTTEFTTAGGSRTVHPTQSRALTIQEGIRLQSFPDSYTFCGTKTSIVEQVGNAVPPLLGKAIATAIKPHFTT